MTPFLLFPLMLQKRPFVSSGLAPGGKAPGRVQIGFAGVVVVDLRGEELQHAPCRFRRRREQRGRKQAGGRGEDD